MPRLPLEKSSEPELGCELIPKERYVSREFMQLESERLWSRVWLMAGPLSDLRDVGDYLTFEIGRESIIVVRSSAQKIEAFHNACQHRGFRLCQAGVGHEKTFVCPYHLWAYDLHGGSLSHCDAFPECKP